MSKQVVAGSSASFAQDSQSNIGPYPYSWEVKDSGGTSLANSTSGQENGWMVTLSGTTFTITAPGSATIATGYQAFYFIPFDTHVVTFDVIAAISGPGPRSYAVMY